MEPDDLSVSRRDVLAAMGIGSVGALAACTPRSQPVVKEGNLKPSTSRLPVVYLPHGGGPWPFVDLGMGDPASLNALAEYLRSLRTVPSQPPRAILMISAHWEEDKPTVMTSPRPPMLYDYYGFPAAAYTIQWPAPGDPALASRVRSLLSNAGFSTGEDRERGFDHGTFVPLKLTYPDADVPTIQLSLKTGLDPAEHIAIGRALAPLRDEGVYILGSGMSYHNMRGFFRGGSTASERFDAWLGESVTKPAAERNQLLTQWAMAPAAREAHPREEHLLPLMVIAGAAGEDVGTVAYRGAVMNQRISAFHFG